MTEQAVGLLGSSLIVPESNKFLHNQRLGLVQVHDGENWNNDFFHHQFNTKFFRNEVQSTASGVKVRHTSPKKLEAIKIAYPNNIDTQKAIALKLNKLAKDVKKVEVTLHKKIKLLEELKQSLLQKAFTGELTADWRKQQEEATV